MSAVVDASGNVRQLDARRSGFDVADENIREEDVKNSRTLATLLVRILRDLKEVRRRFWPRHLDFEDQAVDATGVTLIKLPHQFKGRVRWWVVDWIPTVAGTRPALDRSATNTTENVLVLVSNAAGTATIRVEETG